MSTHHFDTLISDFAARIGLPGLAADGDDIAFEAKGIRLHLSPAQGGGLSIWTVLPLEVDDADVFRRACEVNFLLAFSGEATIAFNRDTRRFLLVRAEDVSGRDAAWLEARIATFLAAAELAGALAEGRADELRAETAVPSGTDDVILTFRP